MKSVFLMLFLALSVSAKTVNLSDYATPDDGQDDSPGFQAAVDDLKSSGGGTIVVNGGEWQLKTTINFTNSNNLSFKIVGDGGSVIKLLLGGGPNGHVFYAGNINHFVLENLTVTGDGSASNVDCEFLLLIAYAQKVIVRDSRFFGIRAGKSLMHFGNVDALVENSQFDGNAVTKGQIYGGPDLMSLTVRNTGIRDYANFFGYISKTPFNTGSALMAEYQAGPPLKNYASGRVRLEEVRIDEGSPIAVTLRNIPNVEIDGLSVNVSGVDGAAGVLFDNVAYANIKNASFGHTTNARPALRLINKSTVQVTRLSFGGGVYFADVGRKSFALINNCPECDTDSDVTVLKSRPASGK